MATVIALARLRNKHFEAVRSLSSEDIEVIEKHRAVLRRYEDDSMNLGHLSQEFVALEDLIRRFTAQLEETRGTDLDPRRAHAVIAHAQRHVINFLNLFRAFDDHTARRLRKRFGEVGMEVREYAEARKHLFDSNFAYRFLSKLRHFAQHKRVPIGHVGLIARAGGRSREVEIRFELGFLRDDLLAEDTKVWTQPILEELRAGPPVLPLIELLKIVLLATADLQLHVQRWDTAHLLAACDYFEVMQKEVSADALPVLLLIDTEDSSKAQVRDVFRLDLVAEIREQYGKEAASGPNVRDLSDH